jgi:hypothetical protein
MLGATGGGYRQNIHPGKRLYFTAIVPEYRDIQSPDMGTQF